MVVICGKGDAIPYIRFREGGPEVKQLLLSHVCNLLHTFLPGKDVAEEVEMSEVEHRYAMRSTTQVDPIGSGKSVLRTLRRKTALLKVGSRKRGFVLGLKDEVPEAEIAVQESWGVFYFLDKGGHFLQFLAGDHLGR